MPAHSIPGLIGMSTVTRTIIGMCLPCVSRPGLLGLKPLFAIFVDYCLRDVDDRPDGGGSKSAREG